MAFNPKQIHLLEVALKLFAQYGYDGTSVRKIAEEAGMNQAMISYYFGSKEELLKSLLIYRLSNFHMQIELIFKEDLTWMQKVDKLVEITLDNVHRNRKMHKIMTLEGSDNKRQLYIQKYIDYRRENFEAIADFIRAGQREKVFAENISLELLTTTIVGTYLNFYYNNEMFRKMHAYEDNWDYDKYVYDKLIPHIQQTTKGLLIYEV